MQYVVLCHTNTVDRSDKDRSRIHSQVMLRAVNREDANALSETLNEHDQEVTYVDGPFRIQRVYEVAGVVFTNSKRVILSLSDMEMIASEVTRPSISAKSTGNGKNAKTSYTDELLARD